MAEKMFSISLDRIASKKALDLMERFPEKMGKANNISLFRIGTRLRSDAGVNAPYRTGNLRRSLTTSNSDSLFKKMNGRVEVGSNLRYASIVEFKAGFSKKWLYMTRALKTLIAKRYPEKVYSEEIDYIIK